ncbi:Unc-93-like protein A [Elysia marginata]|uniref:Unc-93-like protein A n=1 Tax=Elysia marginata TaxID=1093978 RepID=A0AAV4ENI0_9GAST|nr:Unc-93-like protein A [Elysia marginata]
MVCARLQDVRRLWKEGQSLEGREVRSTVIITIAFQLLFTAFNALQNLHSSLHDEEFLGLTCLAIIYGTATVSSILAPAIIARLGAKTVLVLSFGAHCFYILANLYPSFASMAPVAIMLGFFHGPAWTCQSLYVTACAFSYSKRASSSPYNILSRFNSLFFGVLASTQIAGNLITSTVIRDGVGNISETIVYEFCGANDCPANENATEIGDPATWVIDTTLGVLLGCALLGLVLVVVLLAPLPRSEVVQNVSLRSRLLVYFRVVMTTKMILLAPFMLFSSVQHAFLVSVFTKAYVACPIGIHNVGFVMASYGATTPVFMAIFGQLARVTGRFILLVASLVTNLILLVVLFSWAPTAEDEAVMYVVAIVWGLVESILLAQANALIAMLYPDDKEAAFANYHAWRSLGYTVSFANSTYLCVSTKLVLCILLVCLALVLYVYVEIQAKVQEYKDLKKRELNKDEAEAEAEDEQTIGVRERPVSSGGVSYISLEQVQACARKSFDFVELSEIIKEAQSSWTRDRDSLTLDLPKVMSRDHLQHSKVTTWFHTISLSEEEFIGSFVDASPSRYAQSSIVKPAPLGGGVYRSKSDSNLKIAEYRERMSGGEKAGRRSSDDNFRQRSSPQVFRPGKSRRNSNLDITTATRGGRSSLNGAVEPRQRRASVFQKFKDSLASRKRLSLQVQIPDINIVDVNPPSSSRRASALLQSPSSGYGSAIYSIGSRSPVSEYPGEVDTLAVGGLYPPKHDVKRHSLDVGALSRVHAGVIASESEPVVTFHLGSEPVSPEVETTSAGMYFPNETKNNRRRFSEDIRIKPPGDSTTQKSGIFKAFSKMKRRSQTKQTMDDVINVAFAKTSASQTSLNIRPGGARIEQESSDVDSDGFEDEDDYEEEDEDEEDEANMDYTLSQGNSKLSTVKALRKKRKKILSQTEDVSSIY